jgi:hypothetical protein
MKMTPSGAIPLFHKLSPLGLWLLVYPCRVTELARWELEHPLEDREWSILLLGQLDRDIRRSRSSCGIVTRAIALILGHGSVCVEQMRSAKVLERSSNLATYFDLFSGRWSPTAHNRSD